MSDLTYSGVDRPEQKVEWKLKQSVARLYLCLFCTFWAVRLVSTVGALWSSREVAKWLQANRFGKSRPNWLWSKREVGESYCNLRADRGKGPDKTWLGRLGELFHLSELLKEFVLGTLTLRRDRLRYRQSIRIRRTKCFRRHFASDSNYRYPVDRDWQWNNWFETSYPVSLFLFSKMNQESKILRSCFESKNQETVGSQFWLEPENQ